MDTPETNLEQDDAFAVRMQFGTLLGDLKDWSVKMGQLPMYLNQMLEDWDDIDISDKDQMKELFTRVNEHLVNGLSYFVGLIQENASNLFGEPFPNASFAVDGMELHVRNMDEVVEAFEELPQQLQDYLLETEQVPEEIKEILRNKRNKGENNG
jgi:methyl-accepting chemotaxis protein